MFKRITEIFIAPKAALTHIVEQPSWLLPWMVAAVALASVQLGFYLLVDADYLLEQLVDLRMQPGISENDLRVITQTAVENKTLLGIASAFAAATGLLIWIALNATYLFVLAKLNEEDRTYKHWLSLCAWCSLPAIFTALAAWLIILSSGASIDLAALNPLSLAYLLSSFTDYNNVLFDVVDLTTFWMLALTILGYQELTDSKLIKATTIVLAPYLGIAVFLMLLG